MDNIDRQFDYRVDAGPMKLLGVLCIILAPLSMWMSFQEGSANDGLFLTGRSWFAYIPAPLVPWVIRAVSIACLWIAYALIKGAGEQQQFGGRIAFTPVGLIYEAGKPDGVDRTIKYRDITGIRLVDKGARSMLYFKDASQSNRFIAAKSMKSKAEFDEMAAMLQTRVPDAARSEGTG